MILRMAKHAAAIANVDYAELRREHRATWRTNGYGYDVTCRCGWDSRTGYAIKSRVIEDHDRHVADAAYVKGGLLPAAVTP